MTLLTPQCIAMRNMVADKIQAFDLLRASIRDFDVMRARTLAGKRGATPAEIQREAMRLETL